LFPQVISTADAYGLDPAREGYPDLIALPDESYWVRTKLAPGQGWVDADPTLPGTHRPEGVVALCASGVAAGRNLQANLSDVTPTILKLLGLPIPAHVEGKPLPCLSDLPHAATGPTSERRRRSPQAAVRIHARRAGHHRAAAGRPRLSGMSSDHVGQVLTCRRLQTAGQDLPYMFQ